MQIEESRPRWGIVAAAFLFLTGLASLPFFLFQFQPKDLPTYEVQNFIGQVEIYSAQTKAWLPAKRGQSLRATDRIRTATGAEIDLRVPDQIHIRIKENSELALKRPNLLDRALRYRLHLRGGNLVGLTGKKFKERFAVSTPALSAVIEQAAFQIETDPQKRESAVRVLEGLAKVRSVKSRKTVVIRALEKTEVKGKAGLLPATRISRQEWNKLKEGYELFEKSAAAEARQLDLAKKAGNFFRYVIDHGTFYTLNFGFADREFIRDEAAGKVYLKLSYDVFPTGSFVGAYLKTRGLDLARFKSFELKVRRSPEESYPESVRIEIKGPSGIIRAFVPHNFKETWQTFQYPLRFTRPAPVSEITIVVSNEKAGDAQKGSLYFQDFTIVPLEKSSPTKQTKVGQV